MTKWYFIQKTKTKTKSEFAVKINTAYQYAIEYRARKRWWVEWPAIARDACLNICASRETFRWQKLSETPVKVLLTGQAVDRAGPSAVQSKH